MIHDEVEQLLGAYALHAVDSGESQEIEAHLAECPRCRAEVDAHRDMAAMFAGPSTEAPPGLWEKISVQIADGGQHDQPPPHPVLGGNVVPLQTRPRPRSRAVAWGAVAAIAAGVMAFLGAQVAHLGNEVNTLRSDVAGNALTQALLEPHQTVTLASSDHSIVARVFVFHDGQAVWYSSSLGDLPSSETYQMWGLSHGQVVSLGLMGPDPHALATFMLAKSTTKIMVTAEPQGGTPKPTTTVVALGNVPPGYVN